MNEQTTEQLLPSFQPSEKDLVNMALAQPLEDKIRRSIALLQHYEASALKLSDCGYYLAFSGGKDSCVIKQLAIESGVKFKAWYNLTTIDPPELVQFIKKHHADVAWNKPKIPMMKKLVSQSEGMPSRKARWCCKQYKECGGSNVIKVIGVRVFESPRRERLWKEFKPDRNNPLAAFVAPIVYWTDSDVWEFIRSRSLPYCDLYDQGFSRLGCVGCPLASDKDRLIQFKRWPKYEIMWKKACFAYWSKWESILKRNGEQRAFVKACGSADGMWNWFLRQDVQGEAQCFQEEMDMNT